jgi:mRNA interferase MazF
VQRGEILLVELSPTRGREIRKTRPCLVVSPNEINSTITTLIVAPLTTGSHPYPFRVPCRFAGRTGHILVDQIRTVDHERILRRLGRVSANTLQKTLSVLQAMFVP